MLIMEISIIDTDLLLKLLVFWALSIRENKMLQELDLFLSSGERVDPSG
jgi:hypothetical protein